MKKRIFSILLALCLLAAALAAGPRWVVVKRPLKAPALAGRKPSHSVEGKTIRYDDFVPAR